jgi:hypothetical protein
MGVRQFSINDIVHDLFLFLYYHFLPLLSGLQFGQNLVAFLFLRFIECDLGANGCVIVCSAGLCGSIPLFDISGRFSRFGQPGLAGDSEVSSFEIFAVESFHFLIGFLSFLVVLYELL